MSRLLRNASLLLIVSTLLIPAVQAEVIEEIVALVDGDILTKSDYDTEEQTMVQEIYRRFSGEELDNAIAGVHRTLLMDLIDRKILVHRAERMFDTDRMGDVFYESFREQQQVTDDAQFEAMLAREGMNLAELKKRLISMFAPDEVVRSEVSSRISVSDAEVEAYYAANPAEFRYEDEVQLREIVLLAETDAKKDARRAEAEQVRARVSAENFAEIAAASSDAGTRESGGLLGPIKRGDLSAELEQIAFEMPAGSVSDLIELPHGFHILFAEETQVGELKELQDVRASVRAQLEDSMFSERMKAFMIKARSESKWCVKAAFVDALPEKHANVTCKEM